MSEGLQNSTRLDDPPEVRHHTAGRPLPGFELRTAAETGELQIRGDLGAHRESDVDASVAERRRHTGIPHLLGQELDLWVSCPESPAERRERFEAGAP